MTMPFKPSRVEGSVPDATRFAVIDLASVPALQGLLMDRRHTAIEPLFTWKFAHELLAVGPWLVRLTDAPDVAAALSKTGEDVPWGYYVHSRVDILTLRKSLRRYNRVTIPNPKREVLFRYWDPRVMGPFLQVMTEFQRTRLFEWIDCFEMSGTRHYGNAVRVA